MEFDEFLRETALLLGLRWRYFLRRGIKRKVERRIAGIGLSNFAEYLSRVKKDPEELNQLSKILIVTISRFFRDKEVFHILEDSIIPILLKEKGRKDFQIWSIGCASGEEPYSFCLLWKKRFEKSWPKVHLSILATDIDENMIERAKEGRYKKSSLKEMPNEVLRSFFKMDGSFYVLDRPIREGIEFKRHDIIHGGPFSGMDIIFCRNLAFTYFSKERQIDVLKKIAISLKGKGYLVIGKDESLPLTYPTLFVPIFPDEKIYQKFDLQNIV
jgi:chemotaxis protein methyltransferase CheR